VPKIILTNLFSFFLLAASPAYAGDVLSLELAKVTDNFFTTGYGQAELTAVFMQNGTPVVGVPVIWKIRAVENRSEALPPSEKQRVEGLRWEHPYPSGKKIGAFTAATNSAGTAIAILTDIIGERTVIVSATAEYNGIIFSAEQKVVFGNGPLSLFAAPLSNPVTWLELYEICNGEPYQGNPADWEIGIGVVGGGKMPSLKQMQAISMPSEYNRAPNAIAAAVVAGWPTDRRYWTSRAVMKGRAGHMDILNGTQHGSGGNDVFSKEYGVCLK
jgi:hypothetical protein